MRNNRAIKIAFLISLAGHCLFLGMPGINILPYQNKLQEDITVRIEIEKVQLLPEIDVIGKEKKFPPKTGQSLTEKKIIKEENPQEPKPEEKIKEEIAENPEPLKKIIAVKNPQEEAMLRYQDMIKQKIESCRKYPNWAKKQRFEGISFLTFTLLSSGMIQDIKITHSSGFDILDKEAISTVKRASPFKPIPEKFNCSNIIIEVSLVFTLKDR